MKEYIAAACIWILRKLNVSVIINFKCTGTIKGSSDICCYYDNDFSECTVLSKNDEILDIPHKQPFRIQIPLK